MSRLFTTLKHYLVPHRGNKYKPRILAAEGIVALVLVLAVVEGAYFMQTAFVYTRTNFLASVLPGAIAALTNETRAASGLSALAEDPLLDAAAQAKADDMAARGYFSHVSPDGKTPWYWLQRAGYDYSYAGENLAINFVDSADVEKAWIESPPHYANIVKAAYTHTGIGVSHGLYQGQETVFVVQFFATAAHEPIAQVTAPRKAQSPSIASSGQRNVLGAEVQGAASAPAGQTPRGAVLDKTLTSPRILTARILLTVLAGLLTLFLVVFFVRAKVRHRVKHREVIGGGIVLCILILALLAFNQSSSTPVGLPHDSQAASVSLAF